MTGTTLTVEIKDHGVEAVLQRLAEVAADPAPVLEQIREYLLSAHDQRWAAGQAPDGTPWAPLSPKYRRRKARRRPRAGILVYDEYLRLLNSRVEGDTVIIGTDRIYGATHQFGDPARNIPARPFLGISEADTAEIEAILADYLQAVTTGQ